MRRPRRARCRGCRLGLLSAVCLSQMSSRFRLRIKEARTLSSAVTVIFPASIRIRTRVCRSTSMVPLASWATRTGSSSTRTPFQNFPMAPTSLVVRLCSLAVSATCSAGDRPVAGVAAHRRSWLRHPCASQPAQKRPIRRLIAAPERLVNHSSPPAVSRTRGRRLPRSRRSLLLPAALGQTRCVHLRPTLPHPRPYHPSAACLPLLCQQALPSHRERYRAPVPSPCAINRI